MHHLWTQCLNITTCAVLQAKPHKEADGVAVGNGGAGGNHTGAEGADGQDEGDAGEGGSDVLFGSEVCEQQGACVLGPRQTVVVTVRTVRAAHLQYVTGASLFCSVSAAAAASADVEQRTTMPWQHPTAMCICVVKGAIALSGEWPC